MKSKLSPCSLHSLPFSHICTKPSCISSSFLLCPTCNSSKHAGHRSSIVSINSFFEKCAAAFPNHLEQEESEIAEFQYYLQTVSSQIQLSLEKTKIQLNFDLKRVLEDFDNLLSLVESLKSSLLQTRETLLSRLNNEFEDIQSSWKELEACETSESRLQKLQKKFTQIFEKEEDKEKEEEGDEVEEEEGSNEQEMNKIGLYEEGRRFDENEIKENEKLKGYEGLSEVVSEDESGREEGKKGEGEGDEVMKELLQEFGGVEEERRREGGGWDIVIEDVEEGGSIRETCEMEEKLKELRERIERPPIYKSHRGSEILVDEFKKNLEALISKASDFTELLIICPSKSPLLFKGRSSKRFTLSPNNLSVTKTFDAGKSPCALNLYSTIPTSHKKGITCLTMFGDDKFVTGSNDFVIRFWDLSTFKFLKGFRCERIPFSLAVAMPPQNMIDKISLPNKFRNGEENSKDEDQTVNEEETNKNDKKSAKGVKKFLTEEEITFNYKKTVVFKNDSKEEKENSTKDGDDYKANDENNSSSEDDHGMLLITGHQEGYVMVVSESFEVLYVFKEQLSLISSLVCLKDGRTVVSGSYDSSLVLYDIKTFTIIHKINEHTESVNCLDISNDFNYLASGGDDTTIRIWELMYKFSENSLILNKIKNFRKIDNGHTVKAVKFLLAQQDFLLSNCYNVIKIWNLKTGTCVRRLGKHDHYIYRFATIEPRRASFKRAFSTYAASTSLIPPSDSLDTLSNMMTSSTLNKLDSFFILTISQDHKIKLWESTLESPLSVVDDGFKDLALEDPFGSLMLIVNKKDNVAHFLSSSDRSTVINVWKIVEK